MKSDIAAAQREADLASSNQQREGAKQGEQPTSGGAPSGERQGQQPGGGGGAGAAPTTRETKPTRFYGSVELDATRLGRDASQIAEEVITHLSTLDGARVRVTIEIEAEVPKGVDTSVMRIVSENCRTLGFTSQGFEGA